MDVTNYQIVSTCLFSVSPTTTPTKRSYTYIRRKEKPKRRPIFEELMVHSVIDSVLSTHCSKGCLQRLTNGMVKQIRMEYLSRNRVEKNEWISNYLQHNVFYVGSKKETRWHIGGRDVCKKCWMLVTTVSKHKLTNCSKLTHSSKGISRQTDRMSSVLAWLSNYFSSACDQMPTKDEFHLPCYILWKDILDQLNEYLTMNGSAVVTLSYFTTVSKITCSKITTYRSERNISTKLKLQSIQDWENVIFALT